jgi:DNA repair protein SbcD/Mre11
MKFFHTGDWHLGKLVQGVYMTEDQQYVLEQFIQAVEQEKPDAVVIAGDLYDRAVPPVEAVHLLDSVLATIVLDLETPVLAVAGNHDSPSRLNFGSGIMKAAGFHIVGELSFPFEPVVLRDQFGEVHFHLIPYAEPSIVRHLLGDESVRTHDDSMRRIVELIGERMDAHARHVFVGHAFVTPNGEAERNTSDSERPLAIGGVEHVSGQHFVPFHYTALGHLHQAHYVGNPTVQYSGSPMKYSISEERHAKGYFVVELDVAGHATVEKRPLLPLRDLRTVEGYMEEIERHAPNDDYVFVRLLDETPVLSPMERVRAVYPNAMHVERKSTLELLSGNAGGEDGASAYNRAKMDDLTLFKSFYKDVKGEDVSEETQRLFIEVLQQTLRAEGERHETVKADDDGVRAV